MRRLSLCLAVVANLSFAAMSTAQIPNEPSRADSAAAWRKADQGATQAPITVKLMNTGKSDQETTNETERVRQEAQTATRMFWLTVAIGLIGFLQLVAFVFQAIALKQTVAQMRREEERRLRAYVFVEGVEFEGHISTVLQCCHLNAKNSGQTPAYSVSYWAELCVREFPLVGGFDSKKPHGPYVPLAPGGSIRRTVWIHDRHGITGDQADALNAGTAAFYLHGEVLYRDVFKRQRKTPFRLVIYGHEIRSHQKGMTFCTEGNEAD